MKCSSWQLKRALASYSSILLTSTKSSFYPVTDKSWTSQNCNFKNVYHLSVRPIFWDFFSYFQTYLEVILRVSLELCWNKPFDSENDTTFGAIACTIYFWSIKLRKFHYVKCLVCSPLGLKIFVRTGDKPLLTLNISIAKICRVLWCIDTELSFSNNLMNVDCLSLYVRHETSETWQSNVNLLSILTPNNYFSKALFSIENSPIFFVFSLVLKSDTYLDYIWINCP